MKINSRKRFLFLLLIIINLFSFQKLKADEAKEIWDYSVWASLGTIYHEIGHHLVDIYNIPVFGNEEDVADSFIVYGLLQTKGRFNTEETYKEWADWYHKILTESLDVHYYKYLLGTDYKEEVITHSSTKRRFYNLTCFMKSGNPEYFNAYIKKRRIDHLLREKCNFAYGEMVTSWNTFIKKNWVGGPKTTKKLIPIFETPEDKYYLSIKNYFEKSEVLSWTLEQFPIELPQSLIVRFKKCGVKNAFYSLNRKEVVVCYELLKDYASLKSKIISLKKGL